MNDVTVGEHEAVGCEDDAGTMTFCFAALASTARSGAPDIDPNDGRSNGVGCVHDGARIRIEQRVVRNWPAICRIAALPCSTRSHGQKCGVVGSHVRRPFFPCYYTQGSGG
jgi:hypothetical protein